MTPVITITERETQLSAMLRTCTEALEATTKERDALYRELKYIAGISNGQVQRVAKQAMELMKGKS